MNGSATRFSLLFAVISVIQLSYAHNNEFEYQKKALFLHNNFRNIHHAPALALSHTLTNVSIKCAEYYLNIRKIDHSCPFKDKKSQGENLYSLSTTGSFDDFSLDKFAEDATTGWYDEVSLYRFDRPRFSKKTGHFTQVVWLNTQKLGFGIAKNDNFAVAVGIYTLPGNFKGQFEANVLRP